MISENGKIRALIRSSTNLNQIKDLDIMMEHILTEARMLVNADAGSIYIREENELRFSYTQNRTLEKRLQPGEKLVYKTHTVPVDITSIVGYSVITGKTLRIKDAYAIDSNADYHFNRQFDEIARYKTRSILTVPFKTVQNKVIGALQVINATTLDGQVRTFTEDEEKILMHYASLATVALERAKMTRTLIMRMMRMAEFRDPKETGAHVNRVAAYAVEIYERWARKYQVPQQHVQKNKDVLRLAAMLHDVGKVAIADAILKKPRSLSAEEYEIMKLHTVFGAQLFSDKYSELDEAAAEVALSHHERWDGKGYPGPSKMIADIRDLSMSLAIISKEGKKGKEIPLFARIVAIADVFDALASRRSYKAAWSEDEILNTLKKEAGHQFDPELIEIFFSCLDSIKAIQERYPD